MKKIVLLFSLFCCFFETWAQRRAADAKHHLSHPEMYSKDTIHIDKDSTMYHIDNLGPNINKEHCSAGARVSPDGQTLYFFKVNHPENLKGTRDIWYSTWDKNDSVWTPSLHMPAPVNNYGDNLVHWISKDGKKLLLHNRYLKNKMSMSGLSMSEMQEDGNWSFPKPVKIKKYKNKDLCSFEMSPDEDVLISAINQPKNTMGQQDLYVSFRVGPNKYSAPVNMGNTINTKGIEATAFLAPDGKTMYFSSNGHRGSMGGFDIYETKRLDESWTKWSKPRHIGAPFNTKDDDLYFSVPDSGDYVYLSRHFGGNKDTNVYSDIIRIRIKELDPVVLLTATVNSKFFNKRIQAKVRYEVLDEQILKSDSSQTDSLKPYFAQLAGRKRYRIIIEAPEHKTMYDTISLMDAKPGKRKMEKDYTLEIKPAFLGKVYSAKDSITPIPATLTVYNKEGKKIYDDALSQDVLFKVYAEPGKYTYSIHSDGYLKDTNEVDMTALDKLGRTQKNFYLKKIEVGLKFTIRNILFKYNSHVLEPYSHWELNRIADILNDSPGLEVEIGGHTDAVGNDAYNLSLSQRRANSVVQYLLSRGITNKIHAKGYGESKPVDTNLTPEGRAVNRRVEFVVLNTGEDPKKLYKPTELKEGAELPPPEVRPGVIVK
jgi:outer membrane protein OmpA-like peptidoglycan-associated protein